MSDRDNFYGNGTDFFDNEELDEQGNPLKKPDENGRHEPPDEEEEAGHEYPPSRPAEKPEDEKSIPESLYKEKSPELFKEKKETLLDPDKDHEFAREQYPGSPGMIGEEETLRNRVVVLHKLSGEPVLSQQGYGTLKETVQKCQPCRQLDYARIENEDLSSITIDEVSFKNGLIENTTFQNARARKSDFSGCEFIGQVSFDGADLRGSSFKGCDLSSCSFVGADLTNCNLIETVLPEADKLAGSILAGIRTEEEKPSPQPGIFPA